MKLFAAIVFIYLTFIPESINAAIIKKKISVIENTIGFDFLVLAAYTKLKMNRSLESLPKR